MVVWSITLLVQEVDEGSASGCIMMEGSGSDIVDLSRNKERYQLAEERKGYTRYPDRSDYVLLRLLPFYSTIPAAFATSQISK